MTVPSTFQRQRRALGYELRGLRESGERTGNQFAKELGWAQSKVSRIETGAQEASEADILAWCSALGLPRSDELRLLGLLEAANAEYLSWKDGYRMAGGAARKQEEILRFERQSRRIFEFQPSVVPGLVQTPAYASELLNLPAGPALFGATPENIADMVAVRTRRQEVLYDKSKVITVAILEAVLRTKVVPEPVLLEQLLRLKDLHMFTSVELQIIAFTAHVPIIPLGGFVIYDEELVVIEGLSGEQQLSRKDEVASYLTAADALTAVAITGKPAQNLIEGLIADMKA